MAAHAEHNSTSNNFDNSEDTMPRTSGTETAPLLGNNDENGRGSSAPPTRSRSNSRTTGSVMRLHEEASRPSTVSATGSDVPLVSDDTQGKYCSTNKILLVVVCTVALIAVVVVVPIYTLDIVKSHSFSCPRLNSSLHGSMSCIIERKDRSETCKFSCEQGYSIVGNDSAMCIDGKWSNEPPTCAANSPNCSKPSPPSHGNLTCNDTLVMMRQQCQYACDAGYNLVGNMSISCIDGKWDARPPSCLPICPNILPIQNRTVSCTNGDFENSTCEFKCRSPFQIHGVPNITCTRSGTWSAPEPTCKCSSCYTGTNCQYSISWLKISPTLSSVNAVKRVRVNFGGHDICCKAEMHSLHSLKLKFAGVCEDLSSGATAKCNDYSSPSTAAVNAGAALLRNLAEAGMLPQACDASEMPTEC